MRFMNFLLIAMIVFPSVLQAQESHASAIEKWPEVEIQMAAAGCAVPIANSNIEAYKAKGRAAGVEVIDERELRLVAGLLREEASRLCQCIFGHVSQRISLKEFKKVAQQNPGAFMQYVNVPDMIKPGGACEMNLDDLKERSAELKREIKAIRGKDQ